jgi:hypothetical protein
MHFGVGFAKRAGTGFYFLHQPEGKAALLFPRVPTERAMFADARHAAVQGCVEWCAHACELLSLYEERGIGFVGLAEHGGDAGGVQEVCVPRDQQPQPVLESLSPSFFSIVTAGQKPVKAD